MKKQTRQFTFFLILLASLYVVLFSSYSYTIKITAFVVYVIIMLSISYVLILENRSAYNTLLWLYVLWCLPIFGYIFFLYSGQLEVKGHLYKRKRNDAGQTIKTYSNARYSEKWKEWHQEEKDLIKLVENAAKAPISFYSKTEVLKNGTEKFERLLEELENAHDYIHIQYYIFRSDEIGNKIINLLIEKAKSGVEVRMLYDGIGSLSLAKSSLKKMTEAGVEIYSFVPLKHGFFNQKLNFRNHRKIVVIDGKSAFVGGLNVGDEYLSQNPFFGFWRDTHLIVFGEAVQNLNIVFLLDWQYVSGKQLIFEKYLAQVECEGDGGVQVVPSGPDMPQGTMSDLYYSLISQARESVWIATPYFIPNKAIRQALKMTAAKGIEIKLLVPKKNDGFLTQYATRSYYGELLRAGVDVYEYERGFLHQKVIITDGKVASIGTANMDLRSFKLNFEINVILYHTLSVHQLLVNYREDLKDSQKINLELYQQRSLWLRTKESFARLFSPVL